MIHKSYLKTLLTRQYVYFLFGFTLYMMLKGLFTDYRINFFYNDLVLNTTELHGQNEALDNFTQTVIVFILLFVTYQFCYFKKNRNINFLCSLPISRKQMISTEVLAGAVILSVGYWIHGFIAIIYNASHLELMAFMFFALLGRFMLLLNLYLFCSCIAMMFNFPISTPAIVIFCGLFLKLNVIAFSNAVPLFTRFRNGSLYDFLLMLMNRLTSVLDLYRHGFLLYLAMLVVSLFIAYILFYYCYKIFEHNDFSIRDKLHCFYKSYWISCIIVSYLVFILGVVLFKIMLAYSQYKYIYVNGDVRYGKYPLTMPGISIVIISILIGFSLTKKMFKNHYIRGEKHAEKNNDYARNQNL